MPGAPNCQNPVWSPEELAIISSAWDVAEACHDFIAATQFNKWTPSFNITVRCRSYKAIESCWCRLHPVLDSHNTPLERLIGEALDELEQVIA